MSNETTAANVTVNNQIDGGSFIAGDTSPDIIGDDGSTRDLCDPSDKTSIRVLIPFDSFGTNGTRRFKAGEKLLDTDEANYFLPGAYARRMAGGFIGVPRS